MHHRLPHCSRLRVAVLVSALWLAAPASAAPVIIIPPGERGIGIAVGSAGGTIDLVSFSVPTAQIGNGVPITGDKTIYLEVGTALPNNTPVLLTADTVLPLADGIDNIPFSQITLLGSFGTATVGGSCTSSQPGLGNFGPITLGGGAGQIIYSFPVNAFNGQRDSACSVLSFTYANTQNVAAGTYSGRVRFTVTAP